LQDASTEELLKQNRNRDLLLQRTSAGIHRDDLTFNLGAQAFKSIASQGQRKSLLFALKLAEMDVLKQEKKISPILLLDDVFEKLDEERINNLLLNVTVENEGQVFITDTSGERLTKQLDKLAQPFQLIEL
jgi:DNA replication and repair protein RecF